MNSVRKSRKAHGFTSYITGNSLEKYDERAVDVPEEITEENIGPLLLPDEVVIAEAKNVFKFNSLRTQNAVILGTLFVTNFKISFVTSSLPVDLKENDIHGECLHSDFLGLNDFSLTQIDSIYYLVESDGLKKKKLTGASPLPSRIKLLQFVLKSFRVINFSFDITNMKGDVKIINALLVHRYPPKLDLFYLALDTPPPETGIPSFRKAPDWERELWRTKCQNWRVSKHNEHHKAFPSLPSTFVVPHCITDNELAKDAPHFRGNRPPIWVWGTPRGAALVRMAQLSPNVSNSKKVENNLIKLIHKSHSQKVAPTILELDNLLPSLKVIQTSFAKLKDLHTPDSVSSLNDNEKSYLSRWQSSGWLNHVHACLEVAQRASTALFITNSSVILQESEGRDLSCVISSLVQILLDPFARTLRGFHTLVQKEWVALGHPFCVRLGHLKNNSEENCPVWLLFLDCVHQISILYPSALEFTSEYLLALWQASHCSLHSTFVFDSIKESLYTLDTLQEESRESSSESYLWPMWCWWARWEGPQTTMHKKSLAGRRVDYEKRLSVVDRDDTAKRRELTRGEGELRMEEESLQKGWEGRDSVRRRYINVLYVKTLLQPFIQWSDSPLRGLSDPLSSSYSSWNRLKYLLRRRNSDDSSALPYDPSLAPPTLDMTNCIHLKPHTMRVRPWVECFGFWVADSPSDPKGGSWVGRERGKRPILSPPRNKFAEHWRIVNEMFEQLQDASNQLIDSNCVRNGS